MKKKLIILVVIAIMMFAFAGQTASSPRWMQKDFKGLVGDIKVFVNGQQLATRVEPFILQDSNVTMVPLRDLSEALGFAVEWDAVTGQIIISGAPSGTFNYPDQPPAGKPVDKKAKIESLTILRNTGPFYQKKSGNFVIANRHFGSGIAVQLAGGEAAEVVLDLNQRYETLEGYYGVEDGTMNSTGSFRLSIIGDERLLFASERVKPSEYPRYMGAGEINLSGVNRLTFRVVWEESGLGNYDEIIVALANFYLYQK